MTILGSISLWLSLLMGTWSVVIGLGGTRWKREELRESSRRAALVLSPLLGIAVLSLGAALGRRDLNVAYVSDHVSQNLSLGFTVAAIAAGWNGITLVSLFALALLSIPLLAPRRNRSAVLITSGMILIGSVILLVAGNPFRRLGITPVDGRGLDPLLLGPVLLLERPLSILGYAFLGIAISSIPGGRDRVVRGLGVAWLLLAGSLTAGLWQAYRFAGADGGFEWSVARMVAAGAWCTISILLIALAARDRIPLRERLRSPGPLALLLGVICLVVGALGARTSSSREVRVKAGNSVSIASPLRGSYTLTHMGVSRFQMSDRVTAAATLDALRNEKPVGLITSDKRQYFGLMGQPIGGPLTGVGIHRGILEDVRVTFREATSSEEALYQVRIVPFAWLIWLGSALLMLGGLLLAMGLGE